MHGYKRERLERSYNNHVTRWIENEWIREKRHKSTNEWTIYDSQQTGEENREKIKRIRSSLTSSSFAVKNAQEKNAEEWLA